MAQVGYACPQSPNPTPWCPYYPIRGARRGLKLFLAVKLMPSCMFKKEWLVLAKPIAPGKWTRE